MATLCTTNWDNLLLQKEVDAMVLRNYQNGWKTLMFSILMAAALRRRSIRIFRAGIFVEWDSGISQKNSQTGV